MSRLHRIALLALLVSAAAAFPLQTREEHVLFAEQAQVRSHSSPTRGPTTRAITVDAIGPGADNGDDPSFSAGARVQHRLFGEGTVVGQRGGGRMATVLVRFDVERGPRVIASRFLAAC